MLFIMTVFIYANNIKIIIIFKMPILMTLLNSSAFGSQQFGLVCKWSLG